MSNFIYPKEFQFGIRLKKNLPIRTVKHLNRLPREVL